MVARWLYDIRSACTVLAMWAHNGVYRAGVYRERVVNRTAYRSAFIQRVPYSVKSDIQIGEIESGVVRLPSLYGSFYSDPSYAIRERPYGGVDCTVSWPS